MKHKPEFSVMTVSARLPRQFMPFVLLAPVAASCLVCAAVLAVEPLAIISVTNPTDASWKEAPVVTRVSTPAIEALGKAELNVIDSAGKTGPAQLDDLDGDGKGDELVFLATLEAGETRQYRLLRKLTRDRTLPRAHARMSLKGYDGPGWESDVIGYRIYWNLDNAMDVFGKSQPILSLDYWATPGVPHNMETKYGIDVLKVGRSIGIGGFGAWIDDRIQKVANVMKDYRIVADGPLRAVVDLEYVYWHVGVFPSDTKDFNPKSGKHYDLDVRMSIIAGQKWGQAEIRIRPHSGSPMPELVTGFPRHAGTDLIQDQAAGILGRWGRQALGDKDAPNAADLGLGVIVDPVSVAALGEDDFTTYVRLKPGQGMVKYRYHASWGKEPDAATSAREYEGMLRAVARLTPQVKIETR